MDDISSFGGIWFWMLGFWLIVVAIVIIGWVAFVRAWAAAEDTPPSPTVVPRRDDFYGHPTRDTDRPGR